MMGFVARRAKRLLPRRAVTVALVERDVPLAYGVVKDISEDGACIITDAPLVRAHKIIFGLSFYRTGIFAADGRVVWSEKWKGLPPQTSGTLHGIQFVGISASERQVLREILGSPDFGVLANDVQR